MKKLLNWLAAPDGRFGDDPVAGRDRLLADSLQQAVPTSTHDWVRDMDAWRYGQPAYKHVLIRHPMSPAVDEVTRARLDVGPVPRGGYGRTVNNTGNADNQTSGASFRIIADTENWDHSVGTNAPGQSGDPDDPHYRDLSSCGRRGSIFQYSFASEVESVAERTERLVPLSLSR